MIKAAVYSESINGATGNLKLWEGELSAIPPVGDVIFFWDGWGGAPVRRVYWDLADNSVEIYIPGDTTGEYAAELKLRNDAPVNAMVATDVLEADRPSNPANHKREQ